MWVVATGSWKYTRICGPLAACYRPEQKQRYVHVGAITAVRTGR